LPGKCHEFRNRVRLRSAAIEANLKTRKILIASFYGILLGVSIAFPDRLMAQAAPGPLAPPPQSQTSQGVRTRPVAKPKTPEISARKSLEGLWKLNRDESDNPRTKIQDSRGINAGHGGSNPGGGYPGGGGYPSGRYPGGGGYPGGGYPGGGYPGGGNGPYGGHGNNGRNTESDEKLEQLISPPVSLSFVFKNAEVDLTDDHYRKVAFFTDGRKLQKPKDETYQEIAARWDGSRLVSDEKTPQGAKMSRTLELSQDGRQFYETLHLDRGKSVGSLVIRYVYDVASSTAQADHESDPNQPVLRRHADSTSNAPSPQETQTGQESDPNQPVLKRLPDKSNSSSQ
jgi:hypothetical protein